MFNVKDSKIYSIGDFINWHTRRELSISPKYQRNPVWNTSAKSYLIDTIVRGLPFPQIYMRQTIDVKTKAIHREIIDGQQRLRTIIEYVNNEFPILKSHNSEYANLTFDELPEDTRERFLQYGVVVEIINLKDDSKIYDMFARLNSNSISLNRQELRNAKYWGEFKVFVYQTASEWRNFFLEVKTFSDKDMSRMKDVEFITSLVIQLIDGIIEETPSKIDRYYSKYDDSFFESEIVKNKMDVILEVLQHLFSNISFSTDWFHRKNYMYTLFSVLNHQIFGISNMDVPRYSSFEKNSILSNIGLLISRMMSFESEYERFNNEQLYDSDIVKDMISFEKNHRTRTTSLNERINRVSILNSYIG